MVRDNGINYMESLSSIEQNNIFNNKYRGNTPQVLYANGGSWDKLSMRERYNYIHNNYDILANGGTLEDIKRRFAEDENIAVPADENIFSSGGSIHIKPENRGKFTALKKRTGHSASWFKAHGTPAQKKMATFALNARKWKHEDGGYLFGDGGENESKYTPLIYIGGTPQETREKYWQEYPRMGEVVDSIAGVYGIDPILIKNNLNHEGFTDNRIKENNDLFEEGEEYDKKGIVNDFLSGKYTNEYNTHGFSEYGFDDGVGTPIINNEIVLPSHITYDIYPEDNEYGKRVQSISGRTPQDNIEITAIMLKHLSDKIKQEYPNLSDYDHNRYVRAFWNKGISNGKKWVQNGAKGYNYRKEGHLFDGEEEETQRLNNTSGFYNYDRDKGVIQLPWNTPLRQRMADRREAEIIDLRQNRPTFTDWIKELPASFISDFTASDDYVPELLKTDRMKYIDYLNSKYNLQGEKRIRYSDAPDTQRERGRRPWTKEVGFDKRFDIGGNLLGDGDYSNISFAPHNYTNEESKTAESESYIDKFDRKSQEQPRHAEVNIPFIEDKRVKLTDAGLATGAVLSTNLLDSIAKYAEIEGIPVKTAIGIATKESTLGNPTDDKTIYKLVPKEKADLMKEWGTGQHINPGVDVNARQLLNYYKDTWDPYNEAIAVAEDKAADMLVHPDKDGIQRTPEEYDLALAEYYRDFDQIVDSILRAGERYADRQAKKRAPRITGNVIQAAFRSYKNAPNRYNSAQSNYQELVNRRAEEVWNSPEVQEWYRNYLRQKSSEHSTGGPIFQIANKQFM